MGFRNGWLGVWWGLVFFCVGWDVLCVVVWYVGFVVGCVDLALA